MVGAAGGGKGETCEGGKRMPSLVCRLHSLFNFSRYVLITYNMPGTILVAKFVLVNEEMMSKLLRRLYSPWKKTQ